VEDATVVIRGGQITVTADGDGIDSNGTIAISGGTTIVYGPTRSANGALDANGAFEVSAGTLAAVGSTGMLVTPDETSPQMWFSQNTAIAAGDRITIATSNGDFEFVVPKSAQNIIYSSPGLASGNVTLTVGDADPITPDCHGG